MASHHKSRFTPEEYLAMERSCQQRNEYLNGEIFAMGGASERHNLIVGNLFASLHVQMKGKSCKAYSSDLRVRISATGLYTYPDIVALCERARFDDAQKDTLLNPNLIIEVLSKSTEAYDRGEKFEHYRQIESLAEYLLVSQEKRHIDHFARQPDDQWLLSDASELQAIIELPSIGCRLLLSDVYDKVDIDK